MIFLYFEFGYETLMTISFQDSCALWENGKTQGVFNINMYNFSGYTIWLSYLDLLNK